MADPSVWKYRARPDPFSRHSYGVVDGDTLDLMVDTGFEGTHRDSFRIEGIDTAEIYGVSKDSDEYERGQKHMRVTHDFMEKACVDGPEWPLVVRSVKEGKYGRYIAQYVKRRCDGKRLTAHLSEEYPGVLE